MTLTELKDEADRLRLYLDDQGVALDEHRHWVPRFEWLLDAMAEEVARELVRAKVTAQAGWPVEVEFFEAANRLGAG